MLSSADIIVEDSEIKMALCPLLVRAILGRRMSIMVKLKFMLYKGQFKREKQIVLLSKWSLVCFSFLQIDGLITDLKTILNLLFLISSIISVTNLESPMFL